MHALYSDEKFDFEQIVNPQKKLTKVRADQIRSIERLSKPSVAPIPDYVGALCESSQRSAYYHWTANRLEANRIKSKIIGLLKDVHALEDAFRSKVKNRKLMQMEKTVVRYNVARLCKELDGLEGSFIR